MLLAAAWPWQWSASAWSALTFVVLVGAALLTWRQVREARLVREDQTRPFVMIDFHGVFTNIVEIHVKNIGATLARDVRFEFDPPLLSTARDDDNDRIAELNMFKQGIPSLAPSKEIKVFFDQFATRVESGLPMTYSARVSYTDARRKHDYTETIVLDLTHYLGTGGITRYGLHEIHTELKRIREKLDKWTDWDGLKIVTSADVERKRAQWKREAEERARAAEAASGESVEPNSPASTGEA